MSDVMLRARLAKEAVQVYPLGDGVAMLASPPLASHPHRFGDVVRIQRVDGELQVGTVLRAGNSKTFRYAHQLDRDAIASLIGSLHWLGATPRATMQDIVVGVPSRIDPAPVLRALLTAGISGADEELRGMEIFA